MTYRQFLKAYQQKRKADTPNVLNVLPITESKSIPRTRNWGKIGIPLTAAVAAVAVLSTVLFLQFKPTDPSITPAPPAVSPLKVSTVSYRALQTNANVLPKNATVERYVGARMVAIKADTPFVGHETCTSVFYQLDEKAVFCVDHLILRTLSSQGVTASAVSVHFYDPTREVTVFTVSGGTHASYWLDIKTDTLRELPVSLQHCPSSINTAEQSPYALLHSAGGKHDDIYLIDAKTGDLTNIVKDKDGSYLFDPMEDEQLIANNTYVLYTHGSGDGNTVTSPARTSVLYHIATGNSYTFQGRVEAELADRLLIRHPDGYGVYHLTDHTVTPLENSELPAQYDYQLQQTDLYSRYNYRLKLYNRRTGETALLCDDYLVTHLVSPDYRYVYYYVRGENSIRVCDMATGAKSTLPLFADVTAETESDEHKNNTIFFSLWMNEAGNEIVLTYQYTAHPREDPEAIRKELENSSRHLLDTLCHDPSGGFVSIASLEPILRRFPERVTAYQGDRYLYVDYTRLWTEDDPRSSRDRQVALEDYTSSMFYDLSHIGETFDSQFTVTNQAALSSTAQQDTLRILEACNVSILPTTKDYRQYFTVNTLDELKMHVERAASNNLLPHLRGYYVRKARGYDGAMMGLEEPADLTILHDFLVFSDTLDYKEYLAPAAEDLYLESHTYSVQCYGTNLPFDGVFFIGQRNGQPFLVRNRCLAFITPTDYQKWSVTLADQEPKCHAD